MYGMTTLAPSKTFLWMGLAFCLFSVWVCLVYPNPNRNRMTRKQLCMNWMLAKKKDVDRIYLPCQEGRRSLLNLEKEYKAIMIDYRFT